MFGDRWKWFAFFVSFDLQWHRGSNNQASLCFTDFFVWKISQAKEPPLASPLLCCFFFSFFRDTNWQADCRNCQSFPVVCPYFLFCQHFTKQMNHWHQLSFALLFVALFDWQWHSPEAWMTRPPLCFAGFYFVLADLSSKGTVSFPSLLCHFFFGGTPMDKPTSGMAQEWLPALSFVL